MTFGTDWENSLARGNGCDFAGSAKRCGGVSDDPLLGHLGTPDENDVPQCLKISDGLQTLVLRVVDFSGGRNKLVLVTGKTWGDQNKLVLVVWEYSAGKTALFWPPEKLEVTKTSLFCGVGK